jgi:hypothetical protein
MTALTDVCLDTIADEMRRVQRHVRAVTARAAYLRILIDRKRCGLDTCAACSPAEGGSK